MKTSSTTDRAFQSLDSRQPVLCGEVSGMELNACVAVVCSLFVLYMMGRLEE